MRASIPTALLLVCVVSMTLAPRAAHASRVGDLCDVGGVRPNQLVGYGLVVGLANTGDSGQSRVGLQGVAAMLRRLGATIDPELLQSRNVAAVTVTMLLPAFAQPGARVDVVVSSLGNATSLVGGTLLQTPLYGADRRVYAVAQGSLIVGGFSTEGRSGSTTSRNHTTAARIPAGAIVERAVGREALSTEALELHLKEASFGNARRIADAINTTVGEGTATAVDAGTIRLQAGEPYASDPVGLLAAVEAVEVEPIASARIVIDERTGTIVIGASVRIREVAIAHGGITIEVEERARVSQPAALGRGTTTTTPTSNVTAVEEEGRLVHITPSASLQDLVTALNSLGVRPRDLISILQALRASGAIDAAVDVQ